MTDSKDEVLGLPQKDSNAAPLQAVPGSFWKTRGGGVRPTGSPPAPRPQDLTSPSGGGKVPLPQPSDPPLEEASSPGRRRSKGERAAETTRRTIREVQSSTAAPARAPNAETAMAQSMSPHPSETAAFTFLDYCGLGLILMSIDSVGQRWLDEKAISQHTLIAAGTAMLAGAIVLAVSKRCKGVAGPKGRLRQDFEALASKASVWIVAASAIIFGVPLTVSYVSQPPPATYGTFNPASISQVRPVGPTFGNQLAQLFHEFSQQCLIKLTDPSSTEVGQTISWVMSWGKIPSGPTCNVQPNGLPSADESAVKPTTEPGIVIHWKSNFAPGEKVANFFSSMGLNVRVSHRLDPQAPDNLIWIDIGPGSPWK
jgi:hypothetical protein